MAADTITDVNDPAFDRLFTDIRSSITSRAWPRR
jgi:hypothetical protein